MERNNESSDLAQQNIEAARVATDTLGVLHEFQVTQLRRWPLLVLDGIKSCKAYVDIGASKSVEQNGNLFRKNRPITVSYKADSNVRRKSKKLEVKLSEGAKLLETWTKALFWPDTKVLVYINNKEIGHNERPRTTRNKKHRNSRKS